MSTGAEHYAEAEKLMVRAHDMEDQKGIGYERRVDFIMRRADVHSRLALAAAQIEMAVVVANDESGVRTDWLEVTT